MKILLLGANGQLGQSLRPALQAIGDVIVATRDGLLAAEPSVRGEVADFSEPASLAGLVARVRPALVVNAAAYTAVDAAEQDRATAFAVNATAPGVLAAACAQHGSRLLHYSTDYVFDGTGTRPYREDDATAPLGVYGESKRAGETAIANAGAEAWIFRTAWVYASHGRNFLGTMLRLGAERDELRVVADQVGAPTSTDVIVDATLAVLDALAASGAEPGTRPPPPAPGLWHLTAAGQTSWHGFASAIMAGAVARGLLPRAPRIVPITTAEFPTPARRPAYSVLDVSRLETALGRRLPAWEDALGWVLDARAKA